MKNLLNKFCKNAILPLATALTFSTSYAQLPKNVIPVENIPLEKVFHMKDFKASYTTEYKTDYYIAKNPEKFGTKTKDNYLMVFPKDNINLSVAYYLNDSLNEIIGIGYGASIFPQKIITDLINPVLKGNSGLISNEDFNKKVSEIRDSTQKAKKNFEEIYSKQKKYEFIGELTKNQNYSSNFEEIQDGILKRQNLTEKLKENQLAQKNTERSELERLVEEERKITTEIQKNETEIKIQEKENYKELFKNISDREFSLNEIHKKVFQESDRKKIMLEGKNYFINQISEDTGYVGFIFKEFEHYMEHSILGIKINSKENYFSSVMNINEKTSNSEIKDFLEPYLNNKKKFNGEILVFRGNYSIPLGKLAEVISEEKIEINREQIKINSENKEIALLYENGNLFIIEGKETYIDVGDYSEKRAIAVHDILK